MRIVITVIGKDRIGIVSDVSLVCKEFGINILDITQKVFDDLFAMVMLASVENRDIPFGDIVDKLENHGETMGLKIHAMHEDIFNSMHRI